MSEVGRVIARPFVGRPGAYTRVAAERRDFSRLPTALTLQEALQKQGVRTVAVGKIADLFGGVGFDEVHKTKSNAAGDLGLRPSFNDHAASVAAYFEADFETLGRSFL